MHLGNLVFHGKDLSRDGVVVVQGSFVGEDALRWLHELCSFGYQIVFASPLSRLYAIQDLLSLPAGVIDCISFGTSKWALCAKVVLILRVPRKLYVREESNTDRSIHVFGKWLCTSSTTSLRLVWIRNIAILRGIGRIFWMLLAWVQLWLLASYTGIIFIPRHNPFAFLMRCMWSLILLVGRIGIIISFLE